MNNKKNLVVMCGAPGSGKTTWLMNNDMAFPQPVVIISRDLIRFSLVAENEPYFSKEKEVYDIFISSLKNGIASSAETIVADATHINFYSRKKLLKALNSDNKLKEKCNIIAIVMATDAETCLDRNAKRKGREFVPVAQLVDMLKRFEFPSKKEGFDKIFYVDENGYLRESEEIE